MSRTRLTAVAGVAMIGLLVAGGTALALGPVDAPAVPLPSLASSTTSSRPFPTTAPTSTSSTSTTSPAPAPETKEPVAAGLGPDDAAAIVLRHAGGGRVTGVEREVEHGRTEWSVEVVGGGVERDVRVDAATGTITRDETDRSDDRGGDDRGRGDRGGDDRGGDDHGGDDRGRGSDDGPGHDAGDDHGGDRDRSDD